MNDDRKICLVFKPKISLKILNVKILFRYFSTYIFDFKFTIGYF